MPSVLDEEFLELVCGDDDLVRAEFDAIVAAEWGKGAATGDRPVPAPEGAPSPPSRTGRRALLLRRPHRPGLDGWARQRSPPPAAGPGRTP